jgi:hypothetical protein
MAKKHIAMTIVLGLVTQKHRLIPSFFGLDRQNQTPPLHELGVVTKKTASPI